MAPTRNRSPGLSHDPRRVIGSVYLLAAVFAIGAPGMAVADVRASVGDAAAPGGSLVADAAIVSKDEIQGILGKRVLSGKGEDMGRIVNVIVDHAGNPRAVIVDFGGFLGVGSRKIAVDWNALHFMPQGQGKPDQIVLDVTPGQLKAAPEYQEGKPVVVIITSGRTQPLPPDGP